MAARRECQRIMQSSTAGGKLQYLMSLAADSFRPDLLPHYQLTFADYFRVEFGLDTHLIVNVVDASIKDGKQQQIIDKN